MICLSSSNLLSRSSVHSILELFGLDEHTQVDELPCGALHSCGSCLPELFMKFHDVLFIESGESLDERGRIWYEGAWGCWDEGLIPKGLVLVLDAKLGWNCIVLPLRHWLDRYDPGLRWQNDSVDAFSV